MGILIKDIINGKLTGAARTLLLSCVLVATRKSSGGVRPIAMGEVFYKLAGLYALELVRPHVADALGPHQFGLAPGGSESAFHILQAEHGSSPRLGPGFY